MADDEKSALNLGAIVRDLKTDFNGDVQDVELSWGTSKGRYVCRQQGDKWSSFFIPKAATN